MTRLDYKKIVDESAERRLSGVALSTNEIERLLDIPIGSEEDDYLRRAARRVSSEITNDKGLLWCAVGMDFAPCPMNCEFCSFGEAWGIIKEPRYESEDEITERAKNYASGGAAYIILRTTEFFSVETLIESVKKIKEEVKGDYKLVLNTGELDAETARRIAAGGVYGAYHARRLGEGTATPFDPKTRLDTMRSVTEGGLALISLVEPLGEEHTNHEIALALSDIISCGAVMSGVMARFPVKGTPLGESPMVSEAKIAHTVAVVRLSGGRTMKDVCSHPATPKIVSSGANVVVTECGAIPRDGKFSEKDWVGLNTEKRKKLLESCGYRV